MSGRTFAFVFLTGLALRLPGLLFNGMGDLYQILLEWGAEVVRDGLVDAFAINYGIFSYAMFGVATWAAELVPRFWWAPYKLIILGFDIAVLAVLLRLAPPQHRLAVGVMYWLNPWFILHQAYYGFWEAPHILFGLLAVLGVRRLPGDRLRWAAAGMLLAASAMFKPQGLVHFLGPLGFYLGVQALRSRTLPLAAFVTGAAAVFAIVTAAIVAAGGPPAAIVANYRSVLSDVGGISNGGPGIWRFVAFVFMLVTGQEQTIPFVKMPRVVIGMASAIAAAVTISIQGLFALRMPAGRTAAQASATVLVVLALGSLVMSQFGVRAHINHSFGAMVLFIPIVVSHTALRRLWTLMCTLLGISHVLIFGAGHAALLVPDALQGRYPAAEPLMSRIRQLPAYENGDVLLRIQQAVGGTIALLPGETIVSLLSVPVFVIACAMVAAVFRLAKLESIHHHA